VLAFQVSTHLKKLSRKYPEIRRQFYPQKEKPKSAKESLVDPLLEEEFTPIKGLIHKYQNRVLVLLTMVCASYCRFCTRQRTVSEIEKGMIYPKDLDNMVDYLRKHPGIKEVILSGGDPLVVPETLKLALKKFSSLPQIKVIRIGTRVPVSNPSLVKDDLLAAFKKVS